MQKQHTLFHPRIIKKYLDAAHLLKDSEIPAKPKKEIEKWLSNQEQHKKRKNFQPEKIFYLFLKRC